MENLHKKNTIKAWIVFVAISIGGNLLHFLFSRFPNVIFAAIAPVNESIWEHTKLLFLPLIISAIIMGYKDKDRLTMGLLSAPLTCILMVVASFFYHIVLGQFNFVVDIVAYYVEIALGFWLPQCLKFKNIPVFVRWLIIAFVVIFGMLMIVFSYLPPDNIIFTDLSNA